MIGFIPNKLTVDLETGEDGESKMVFKEWHTYCDDEKWRKIESGTTLYANSLIEKFKDLNLNVEWKSHPEEKAFSMTYVGKNITPALSSIIAEFMPRLVKSRADAWKFLSNVLVPVMDVCARGQIVEPQEVKGFPAEKLKEPKEI